MRLRRFSKPVAALIGFFGCGSLSVLGLLLGCWVFCSLLFGNNPFDLDPFDNARFNRKIWIEDASCVDGSNRRGGMAEDILQRQLHKGMTVEQIKALLDPPEREVDHTAMVQDPQRFALEARQSTRILVYYLGEELGGIQQGTAVDRAWLDLDFDANNRYLGGRIWLP